MPHNRYSRRRLGALLFASAAVGLAKVKAQFDKNIDFSKYKTYWWYPPRVLKKTGLTENDAEVSPLIKAAVNREMARLGLKEVETGGDLKISSWALAESVPSIDTLIYAGASGPLPAGSDPTGTAMILGGFGGYNKEGTIVVNLIDAATKKTAWAAMTTDGMKRGAKLDGMINKAVANMFKKYPVKP